MNSPEPSSEVIQRVLRFRNIDGFDLSPAVVEQAARLGVYRRLQGDIDLNQPLVTYSPQSYDVILSCGVFSHGHVPPRSLVNLVPLCKPGGRLLVNARVTYCGEYGYPSASADLIARGALTPLLQVTDAPYTPRPRPPLGLARRYCPRLTPSTPTPGRVR